MAVTQFDENTVRTCVCSRCWGRLDICFIDGDHVVKCMNAECDGQGFVTKHYANKRLEESRNDALEVKCTLQELAVIQSPDAGKSEDQLLRELGVV